MTSYQQSYQGSAGGARQGSHLWGGTWDGGAVTNGAHPPHAATGGNRPRTASTASHGGGGTDPLSSSIEGLSFYRSSPSGSQIDSVMSIARSMLRGREALPQEMPAVLSQLVTIFLDSDNMVRLFICGLMERLRPFLGSTIVSLEVVNQVATVLGEDDPTARALSAQVLGMFSHALGGLPPEVLQQLRDSLGTGQAEEQRALSRAYAETLQASKGLQSPAPPPHPPIAIAPLAPPAQSSPLTRVLGGGTGGGKRRGEENEVKNEIKEDEVREDEVKTRVASGGGGNPNCTIKGVIYLASLLLPGPVCWP
ncbi:unnamed protein product, partial [Discosporangium mesarthrocarpum]